MMEEFWDIQQGNKYSKEAGLWIYHVNASGEIKDLLEQYSNWTLVNGIAVTLKEEWFNNSII